MIIKHLCYIGLIVLAFCNTNQSISQETPEGKLFIIGGGSRPEEMLKRIVTESGLDAGGYGIVLPMASSEPDSAIYYGKTQFSKIGYQNVHGLSFAKGEQASEQKLDSIRQAKMLYISGGDQSRFMEIVAGTSIEDAIREAYSKGSLISGTSAGAAVMSRQMITGNELKHPEYASTFKNLESDNIELKEGLGMISSIIIDQHFVRRSRYNRLISAIIEYPEMVGIGIDESTAILIKGSRIEVVGESQVIVLTNPGKSKIRYKEKIGAEGLSLDVYLPGAIFSLKGNDQN